MAQRPSPGSRSRVGFHLPAEVKPVFSNLARIAHTPSEFILDFARLLPGDGTAQIVARVIISPVALKMFYRALGENLARYEATFGEIPLPTAGQPSLADLLFRPPRSEEDPTPPADDPTA